MTTLKDLEAALAAAQPTRKADGGRVWSCDAAYLVNDYAVALTPRLLAFVWASDAVDAHRAVRPGLDAPTYDSWETVYVQLLHAKLKARAALDVEEPAP